MYAFQDGDIEVWLNEDDFPDDDISTSMDQPPQTSHHKLVEAYLVFLFMWQTVFRVSDVGIGVLLALVALLLGKTFGLELRFNSTKICLLRSKASQPINLSN